MLFKSFIGGHQCQVVCSYAAACSAAELSVYVTDIWIASDFFQFFLQFFLIFMKLGTYIYVPMHKKTGTDFRNFDFEIFGEFRKSRVRT